MKDAKLLAELMLQLSIYFESDTDDVVEWLESDAVNGFKPMDLIFYNGILKLHKYVMENMA